MRLQLRDIEVLQEIAFHGVVSRDQVIQLGFFSSIPRANARLCPLTAMKLLKRIEGSCGFTSRQSLYAVTSRAASLLDERVAQLIAGRKQCPQFVDHSLMVVDVRLHLTRLSAHTWKHESQIRHRYNHESTTYEFRPDGLVYVEGNCLFIEADRGNASRKAISETFASYDRYATSGTFNETYNRPGFRVLVVTTRMRRARVLKEVARKYRVAISIATLDTMRDAKSIQEVLR